MIILILTEDNQAQNDLLRDASALSARQEVTERVLGARTFTELIAALNAPVE